MVKVNNMIKVGIIGCGGIAPLHVQAYNTIDDVEIISLCDLNISKANDLARKFRVKKTYDNYLDMIESTELDLIDICTPTTTHARIVCDVAKAVPAIMLEKPMALTVLECDEIIKALNKYDTKCCINHLQIFSPHIQKIQSLIQNSVFDLFSLKTTQKESFEILNSNNWAPSWNVLEKTGGIIWEVCAHLAYLQLHFLPEIMEVYALGGKTKYEVNDNFSVLLKTKNNRYGLIELNWVSKETEIVYEFTNKNGERFKIFRDYGFLSKHDKFPPHKFNSVVSNIFYDEYSLLKKWMSYGKHYIEKGRIRPMFNIIREYISSLNNEQSEPVTPEDGRNTVHLLECIKKSLSNGKSIKL